VHVDAVVVDGETTVVWLADTAHASPHHAAPFVVETGNDVPSALPVPAQTAVERLVGTAATALGIRNGPVAGEVVLGAEGPVIIGLGARLSGAFVATHEIPLATGVNVIEAAIRLALGDPLQRGHLVPRWRRTVAQRYLFPTPGTVAAVEGAHEAALGPGIALVALEVGPGDCVWPISSGVGRAGVVLAVGDTREEAMTRAETAAARVRIITVPTVAAQSALLH
jgi:biotin carboxylase